MTDPLQTEYNSERPHESLNNLTPEEYRLMAENDLFPLFSTGVK